LEIKINKDIRNYTESIFFGLSLRQFLFSTLAVLMAILFWFLLNGKLGTEATSWICILAAAPFGALGFVTYNGMNAEKIIISIIRSEILTPKNLGFKAKNIYYEILRGREGKISDQNAKKHAKKR